MLFEEAVGVIEIEIADIEPCEVSGLHGAHADARHLVVDKVEQAVVVGAQDGEHLLAPWFAVSEGGFATGVAHAVDLGDHAAGGVLEFGTQLQIGNDDIAAGEAGHIVGFAGCHEGQAVIVTPRVEAQSGVMAHAGLPNQVAVDFIGNEDELVAPAESDQFGELGGIPCATDGIVGITEDEHASALGDGRLHGGKVEGVATVLDHKRDGLQLLFLPDGRGQERWVDGGVGHDGVHRGVVGARGGVESGDQTGHPDDPLALDSDAVCARHVVDDGIFDAGIGDGVAIDAGGDALLQRCGDFRWGREVHISDPHRQNIAAVVFIPFEAAGVGAIGQGGKIVISRHMGKHLKERVRKAKEIRNGGGHFA